MISQTLNKKILTIITMLVMTLMIAISAQAEIYRWIDESGQLQISDRAPKHMQAETISIKPYPNNNKKLNAQNSGQSSGDNSSEISTTKSSQQKKPKKVTVILYSTTWCGYCKKARQHFRENKIRFKEYDIEQSVRGKKDYKRLQGTGVPIILINGKRLNGFSAQRFQQSYAYEQGL